MKVHINTEVCAGFGICTGIAPDRFQISEDGYAVVLVSDVQPKDEDTMRRAVNQCPAQAISLSHELAADA